MILNEEPNSIRLYGTGLSTEYFVKLDNKEGKRGENCNHLVKSDPFPITNADEDGLWGDVVIQLPAQVRMDIITM